MVKYFDEEWPKEEEMLNIEKCQGKIKQIEKK